MIKALAQECPAGQHWSDQFGGCATDSTTPTGLCPAGQELIFNIPGTCIGSTSKIIVLVGLYLFVLAPLFMRKR